MQSTPTLEKKSIFTNPILVVFSAILCCALWGSATPFIKLGYKVIFEGGSPDIPSTILFAGIRFFFAGIVTVLIYSVARRRILFPRLENTPKVALVGLFQTIIQYFFFYVGLSITTGAKGTVISGSSSFFAILISSLIFRQEKLTAKKIVACVIGFLGIIAINLNGLSVDVNFGDVAVLLSAVSLGVSSVLIKIFSRDEDPVVISGYQFIFGGAVMVVTALILGGRFDSFDLFGFGILTYLSLLSAVAYALWGVLLKHNPVSKVTIFSFMTPVFGVLLTKIILPDESRVDPISLVISLVLVCLGVFLLNYNGKAQDSHSK